MTEENQLAVQSKTAPALRVKSEGSEIEIPLPYLTVEAREQIRQIGWFRCGNCMERLPRFHDAVINHHIAQKHKTERCPKAIAAAIQRRELIEDFEAQQSALSPATKALIARMSQQSALQLPAPSRRQRVFGFVRSLIRRITGNAAQE